MCIRDRYLEAAIGISQFTGLVMMLIVGFGLMFQFPVGVFAVVASGLISLELLKSYRSVVFIFILLLSALLTPPDAVSQLIMGLPTYALFELGLLAAAIARPASEISDQKKSETQSEDNMKENLHLRVPFQIWRCHP